MELRVERMLASMSFQSTVIDPDVYRKKNVNKDESKYYELMLDDVKDPSIFFGANIEQFQLAGGRDVWSTTSKQYVKNVVEVVKGTLAKEDQRLEQWKNKN
eukprot:10125189-Ditylum_brightwellii.AAC.1